MRRPSPAAPTLRAGTPCASKKAWRRRVVLRCSSPRPACSPTRRDRRRRRSATGGAGDAAEVEVVRQGHAAGAAEPLHRALQRRRDRHAVAPAARRRHRRLHQVVALEQRDARSRARPARDRAGPGGAAAEQQGQQQRGRMTRGTAASLCSGIADSIRGAARGQGPSPARGDPPWTSPSPRPGTGSPPPARSPRRCPTCSATTARRSSSSSAATRWAATRAMDDFARDVVLMKQCNVNPVVVHGGGPRSTRC